jgi:transcriptional regulator with XRE-family HTH domain
VDKVNFSEVVKQAIQARSIKNNELARMTGYSAAYISDLLSGNRRWNEESINKVCKALGVEINFETTGMSGGEEGVVEVEKTTG